MPDLIAAIDNGTSESKILWQRLPDGAIELMRMGAEVLEVSSADLLDMGLSGGRPENDAYIKLPDGKLFVLGMKAQGLRGKPPVKLSKYVPAAYKIVAVVGAIAQTANLPSAFSVCLSTLLPYAEYQDRSRFVELLTRHLNSFEFRGTRYSVTIDSLDVRPEGAGLAQNHRSANPNAFAQQNMLMLMLGQRDASLLPFKQGTPQQGIGEHLGFVEFQDDVVRRSALNLSVRDMARLPEYLFQARQAPAYVARIARMVVGDLEVEHKAAQIQAAIDQAEARYLNNLFSWLKTMLGQDLYELDEVVASGGAALYFRPEIEAFFADYPNLTLFWQEPVTELIEADLDGAIEPSLAFRLFDVYGSFRVLASKMKKLAALPAPEPEATLSEAVAAVLPEPRKKTTRSTRSRVEA
ncbi:hypothetical protein H6F67_24280 [Microcoleus sp. FACHB-1515]|uniref:ParM/StbA family protein n=1 Tax=Cyanophyceae TaxID=3028117 RepID=UPI00168634D9|nr:hypothetical protein [Microcoleus sp. FACHB-1515]MBD2092969.1 hypothetical protein [Microcoleus sp. FACHB-1515]